MPTVAQIDGGIKIEQHYLEHNPPHFHAVDGEDEVLLTIATLDVYRGYLKPPALRDVKDWALPRKAALALNWVNALAGLTIQKVK